MKQLLVRLLIVSVVLTLRVRAGESGRPPESFGAHWARVSDGAQMGFVLDELQGLARGRGSEGIVRKHVARGVQFSSILRTAPAASMVTGDAKFDVVVNGTAAQVKTKNGTLQFQKKNDVWVLTGGLLSVAPSAVGAQNVIEGTGVSVGKTFIEIPVSREHDIDRLSRSVTREKLDRALFGTPEKTVSYYFAHYMENAPFVTATYIQFVTDPSWNRVVYGNMNAWIKSYDNVNGPSSLAVDPDGRVFIGETGNKRIAVLRIVGEGADATLQPQFFINNIQSPTDIAHSDNGTPLNVADDFLYVADASQSKIFKYALSAASAALVATFEGFESPTSIVVGKWNGASNDLLYVVDHLGKRIRVFDDLGTQLSLIKEVQGNYSQYFKSLNADHFGNIYVVDNVNSQLFKYTSSLELLDSEGSDDTFAAIGAIDVPFGKIIVDGQGTYWAGFDQLFAVERWSDNSGAQRRVLGLSMKNIRFLADDDVSTIRNAFTLTDFGQVNVRIYNSANQLVRTISNAWMVSGQKEVVWDRRTDSGLEVPPGAYRYDVSAVQTYRDEPVISQTQLSLPMYYHEDCGSAMPADDVHLVTGSSVRWGSAPSETANEGPSSVRYRFTGLNPESEYEVAAEYISHDNVPRLQDMTVNGVRLHDPVSVTSSPRRIDYVKLPKETFKGGEITISINAQGEGSAIISQLWIKETGKGFSAQQIESLIPSAYRLDQNYPNPFNPTTTIRYAIPNSGPVTLKVYDITGREVNTLVNEQKNAGTYEVRFDARNTSGKALASGVYFYQIKTGGFSQTKKLLLLK
ncbi:MAG: C-terminal target protein [Bacteroidetes bacterium]|nr:C-terminal target protein [Bacteroidota bacterium]